MMLETRVRCGLRLEAWIVWAGVDEDLHLLGITVLSEHKLLEGGREDVGL